LGNQTVSVSDLLNLFAFRPDLNFGATLRLLQSQNLLEILAGYLNVDESDDLYRAASYVLSQNLVHGDALTMRTHDGGPITFAEWGYLGKGRFQRRDFRLDTLTQSSAFSAEGSLFAHLGKHEIFTPARTYPPVAVGELAAVTVGGAV